jgi:glucose-1-phosphate cytidylyltransferase
VPLMPSRNFNVQPAICEAGAMPPVAILAGGLGTRLSEETSQRPKPLVEIGGNPILWHVMKQYDFHGMKHFVIALGYKKDLIVQYFMDLHVRNRDLTVRTRDGSIQFHNESDLDWTVHLVDTGPDTMTGGRIKRLAPYLRNGTFMLTWCDGLSDIDLRRLLKFHREHGRLATITAVKQPSRFGHIEMDGDARITAFLEKPDSGEGWINGAFFVLEPEVFEYIEGDQTVWEREPLMALAADKQLVAYRHTSFWQCMDTLREKITLEEMWRNGTAPWKSWEENL